MSQISKATRVVNRASSHLMGALAKAKGSLADLPLGVEKLDPRTEKKRADQMPSGDAEITLTRLLYELRGNSGNGAATPPDNTGGQP